MPEERIIEHFALSDDPQPQKIGETTYEVSDHELAEEEAHATVEEYLAESPAVISQPQMWFIIRQLAKKLGYKVQ